MCHNSSQFSQFFKQVFSNFYTKLARFEVMITPTYFFGLYIAVLLEVYTEFGVKNATFVPFGGIANMNREN